MNYTEALNTLSNNNQLLMTQLLNAIPDTDAGLQTFNQLHGDLETALGTTLKPSDVIVLQALGSTGAIQLGSLPGTTATVADRSQPCPKPPCPPRVTIAFVPEDNCEMFNAMQDGIKSFELAARAANLDFQLI